MRILEKLSVAIAGAAFTTLGTVGAAQALTITLVVSSYNGSSYYLINELSTWTAAQTEASTRGGNLVTINNSDEQSFLVSAFGTGQPLWIGLSDAATEGSFQWVSGEIATYRNWAPNEPSNGPGVDEDYVFMNFNSLGQWNDATDTRRGNLARGIIEAQAVPFEFSPGLGILALGALGAMAQLKSKVQKRKSSGSMFSKSNNGQAELF